LIPTKLMKSCDSTSQSLPSISGCRLSPYLLLIYSGVRLSFTLTSRSSSN
jgi:hypothetical protein